MLSIRSDFIKGYTKGCISKRVIFKKGSYFKKGHISKKQYFKKDHISRMVIFHTGIIKGNTLVCLNSGMAFVMEFLKFPIFRKIDVF